MGNTLLTFPTFVANITRTVIILDMDSAYERRGYIVTPFLFGRAHSRNDPWWSEISSVPEFDIRKMRIYLAKCCFKKKWLAIYRSSDLRRVNKHTCPSGSADALTNMTNCLTGICLRTKGFHGANFVVIQVDVMTSDNKNSTITTLCIQRTCHKQSARNPCWYFMGQGSTLTVVRLGIPSSFCCRTTWIYVYGCPLVKLRKLYQISLISES